MNLEERILGLLAQVAPGTDFSLSHNFVGDGLLDSFMLVHFVTELDRAFSLSIDGRDIVPEHFKDLATVLALLKKYGVQE